MAAPATPLPQPGRAVLYSWSAPSAPGRRLAEAAVTFTSPVAVQFAVTGVCTATSERYGGRCITTVSVGAGQTVTFLLI